jgi:Asp/Glu/hydantoin racemase
MLDTRFPRIAGDLGNPETFPFPALIARIAGATPERVVDRKAEGLLEPFVRGGEALIRAGAAGIATTCGFLSLFQRPLVERLGVPVAASSLLMIPLVERLLPAGRRAGVVTFSKNLLTPEHLLAVGAPADTPVEGVPVDGALATVIRKGERTLDRRLVEAEVTEAGRRLKAAHPGLGAVIVECTNMPPYTEALRHALRLPVYDGYDFLCWFFAGLQSPKPRWNECPPSY